MESLIARTTYTLDNRPTTCIVYSCTRTKICIDTLMQVLCIHMLCYMLDGSVGFSELALWKRMTDRVEEMYQQVKGVIVHAYVMYMTL
jgi:hypothetical protein